MACGATLLQVKEARGLLFLSFLFETMWLAHMAERQVRARFSLAVKTIMTTLSRYLLVDPSSVGMTTSGRSRTAILPPQNSLAGTIETIGCIASGIWDLPRESRVGEMKPLDCCPLTQPCRMLSLFRPSLAQSERLNSLCCCWPWTRSSFQTEDEGVAATSRSMP